jgi:hypothetical protein
MLSKNHVFFLDGKSIDVPFEYKQLIRSKYKKELAEEYGISVPILSRRLKKDPQFEMARGYLDETHVLRIYMYLGWPCRFKKDNHAH